MEQALPEDLATIWQRVREEIRSSLPASTYSLWLQPLRPVCIQGTTLYVTGPDRVRRWVERRYLHRLEQVLRLHTPSLSAVAFVADHDTAAPNRAVARSRTAFEPP